MKVAELVSLVGSSIVCLWTVACLTVLLVFQLLAGLTVAERSLGSKLATTEVDFRNWVLDVDANWLEIGAFVALVTEWLR